MPANQVPVVAAIIRKGDKILIAKRAEGDGPEGGKWEFPGGKIEKGESPEDALAREIMEELDVRIKVGALYALIPTDRIVLMVFLADYVSGTLKNIGCADSRWVKADELGGFEFAAPDIPVARKLSDGSPG
jgi:8-oxo-dGTP diphosphatase